MSNNVHREGTRFFAPRHDNRQTTERERQNTRLPARCTPCPSPGEGFGPAYAHDSAPNAWRGTPSAICERVLTAARVCGAAAQSPSNEYNLVAQAAEPFYVTDVGLAMLTMLPTMPTMPTMPTKLPMLTMLTILTVPTMLTVLTKKVYKQDVNPETSSGAGNMRRLLF